MWLQAAVLRAACWRHHTAQYGFQLGGEGVAGEAGDG